MADWIGYLAFLLASLAEAIGRHCRAGPAVHADDTPIQVLAPGLGKTKTGRLWVVVRDERLWDSTAPPSAFYMYSPDRKGERAAILLGSCRGFLHADGYGGFERLYERVDPDTGENLLVVGCGAFRAELIAAKLPAGRPQDLADVDALYRAKRRKVA